MDKARLTEEETKKLSGRLISIIDKWHSGWSSTDADYSKISAENEIHQLYMGEVLPKLIAKAAPIIREEVITWLEGECEHFDPPEKRLFCGTCRNTLKKGG